MYLSYSQWGMTEMAVLSALERRREEGSTVGDIWKESHIKKDALLEVIGRLKRADAVVLGQTIKDDGHEIVDFHLTITQKGSEYFNKYYQPALEAEPLKIPAHFRSVLKTIVYRHGGLGEK